MMSSKKYLPGYNIVHCRNQALTVNNLPNESQQILSKKAKMKTCFSEHFLILCLKHLTHTKRGKKCLDNWEFIPFRPRFSAGRPTRATYSQ